MPAKTMPERAHAVNLRKGRVAIADCAYVITAVCHQRLALLSGLYEARCVVNGFRSCDDMGLSQTLAFVVMPDHFHWLLILKEGGLDSLLRRLKSTTAIELNKMNQQTGRQIWQKAYYDHAIRADEDVKAVARYIVANPIRAGLVKNLSNFSFWDVCWL
ncbi:REP-associated tyrosine transposase [Deefgea piscis]|uniref:REP-associated tyrosine transposase n=1 Tax=Deefgea piscis TaxID=2739061 RepID=UPI001C803825|nr:transposase [Deefgea piscis]QZA81145.1 transposase [Deefgea piscis]